MENEEIKQPDSDETVEIDVWEFSLDGEEIDELIEKLQKLKQTKTSFEFDVDENNELLVHYEDGEDDSEEESNE